jgi:hypothetical protein
LKKVNKNLLFDFLLPLADRSLRADVLVVAFKVEKKLIIRIKYHIYDGLPLDSRVQEFTRAVSSKAEDKGESDEERAFLFMLKVFETLFNLSFVF